MEEKFDVQKVCKLLIKRIRLILTVMLLGLLVTSIMVYFVITPKYSSQSQLVVTLPKTENTKFNDVNSNLQMISTYKDLIISDLVLDQVKDNIGKKHDISMTTRQLRKMIDVSQNQDSQMFSIQVTNEDKKYAANIANAVAQIFKKNAKKVLNVDRITIISNAVMGDKPVSPNKKLFLFAGSILFLLAGIGIALLAEAMNRTVKDSKYLTEELGITLLGSVTKLTDKEVEKSIEKIAKFMDNQEETTVNSRDIRRRSRL